MFNVGTPELLVILLVALIVLGPNKLPDAARQVGKFMGEFRRMSSGFQNELRDAMQEPVSSTGDGRKSDPVPKATPAAGMKPVSKVIPDEVAVPEAHAADPSSASIAAAADGEATDLIGTDDHGGSDEEASRAASVPTVDAVDDAVSDPTT